MSAKDLIGNLPQGTTAEDVQELLRETGVPISVLRIDGQGESLLATIEVEGMDRTMVQLLSDHSQGTLFRGRKLSLSAPRFLK